LGDGTQAAVLRDPGEAMVAVASPATHARSSEVVYYQLHSTDVTRVAEVYSKLFGWKFLDYVDLGMFGKHRAFAWQDNQDTESSVGSLVDTTQLRGVHPHWLFYFRVAALETALNKVRAAGGVGWAQYIAQWRPRRGV
jgi:predicted enzyme related to lactoylglutathione lyase